MSNTLYTSCGVDLVVLKKLVLNLEQALSDAQSKSENFQTLSSDERANFLVSIALATGLAVGIKDEVDIIVKGLSTVFKSGPVISVQEKTDAL